MTACLPAALEGLGQAAWLQPSREARHGGGRGGDDGVGGKRAWPSSMASSSESEGEGEEEEGEEEAESADGDGGYMAKRRRVDPFLALGM